MARQLLRDADCASKRLRISDGKAFPNTNPTDRHTFGVAFDAHIRWQGANISLAGADFTVLGERLRC